MNQTSSSATSTSLSNGTDFTTLLTNVHLIWIVLLAVLVIAGIVYGARLKHHRTVIERQVAEHAEQAGVEPQPTADEEAIARTPAPAALAPVIPLSTDAPDNAANGPVTQLKGLGPKVATRLGELGIATVGQLAALDHDAAQRLDAQLGAFSGRMERDRWIEQARFLAAGDVKGFEAVFGRL